MQVTTLVQPSANIVHVVNLKRGDVYKRLDTQYASSATSVVFGVITDVMHNGTDAALTALEMTPKGYGSDKLPKLNSFGTAEQPAIFEAHPEEVADALREARQQSDEQIRQARHRLADAEAVAATVERIVAGLALTAPDTTAAIAVEAAPVDDDLEF